MSNWSYTRVGAKDGKGIQSITEYYKLSANTTETFSASTISTWNTSVSQPTSAKPYLLNAELVVYSDGTKEYKAPHVASRYVTDGQAGRGIAGITEYYLATASSSGVTRSTSGWTTAIQTMTSTKKYLWNYEETTYTDDSDPSYTNPCIIGVYGDKGDKGDQGERGLQGIQGPQGEQGIPGTNGTNGKTSYFHIKYSSKANPTAAADMTETPSEYIGTYVDYTSSDSTDPSKYTWARFKGLQGEQGEQGIPGTNGADGQTYYLHIAYATNSTGTSGFSTTTSTNKTYIGQYTDTNATDSTDPTKYKWTKIKGDAGASSYSYVRYSANADGTDFTATPSSSTKYVGFYSGSSSTAPTDKASYTWTKFVGEDGANGTSLTSKGNWASSTAYKVSEVVYYATNKTSYVCKKAHTSSNSILPTNTTYWTVLAAPGTDGTNGTNGTNGQDATQYYMHFVYCDDTTSGTNYSTTESRKYVGIYTDTTQADAATFSEANAKSGIVWSKAEGDDGENGKDGTGWLRVTTAPIAYTTAQGGFTPAFRMSLSTVKTQSGVNNVKVGDIVAYSYNTYRVGYVDSSYVYLATAVSIRGASGTAAKFVEIEAASGLVFKNGSPSQLPLKCIATGFTASSYQWYKDGTEISGATSQTYNATAAGVYKVTANGYSDIATVISVSDGADGNDGRGINSTEISYATSTSNTTAPSSGWQSTVPSVAQGSYLWTRTTIKYTSGSDSVSYTVARQGSNGTNGTSVAISSKSVKYQAGTSGTTAPTGTWSDTVPSVTKGQYLWTKTEVTYSDGNSTTSYSVGYAGTNGTNGTSPYACSVSNENFTVATGTDLKPLSATTYSVKFTAYKGSTQLSAIAPSATIASGKFKVSTPTATGFTVAQSTNGTLTFTTATGTAISANLSLNVTVTYDNGSTETKTITISASKTGAKGATGTSSYSYVRYSANADGTDFTTTPSSATKYVGFYSGTSSTAPTDKASYTWTKFVGEDGANGTSLTSKGNWASGTAYKVSEVVYYATNKTSYVCKKAHTSSSSILPTNTTYWTVLAAPGTDGQDATQYYMHFVYCDDTSSGTNYSTTESRKYVGIYTDTTQADAATFSAANAKSGIIWSKAEGDDGTSPTVSSTAVTYQQADSGTSVPTGTWSATPPTATAGKYMWTKTVVTYSDSATSTSYAVSKNGSNGTNGTSPWTVTCSEPSLTLACGAEKTVTSEKSITIKFNAFQGTSRKAATIATSTLPSGVTVTSNTAATTSADGSLVLKVAAGANLGGTTAAYNTVIITLTVTANSVAYTFSLTLSKQVSGQWQSAMWLDLTAATYDTNTWYPVTGTAMPKNPQKFQVSVRGDGQTNIPWSSHSTGKIGVEFCVEDVGIAWGWLPTNQCTIFSDTFAQTKAVTGCANQSPVSYTQMSNSSTPVIWLRGGAKYYVESTYNVTWTIRAEATTISSQTVTPSANTRPTPRGVFVRGKGIATVAEYYKLSASTTETFDSSTVNSWSTSPSSLVPTAAKPYLLNAERITLTDGVSTTYEYKTPHICLTYQEDGADGRGITSITNVYKLTTNTTKPTAPIATDSVWDGSATGSTSVWGTVCPTTTTTNKYLWNCERIKYDDDTYTVTPVALLSTHGATGTRGTVWYSGTGITGTSTTAIVFSNSGVTSAIVGDMYKNTDTSNTYRCTTAGNASTAKWVYVGTIKGDRGFSSRTIAFRANYSAFSSPEVGEVYVCGYDSNGAEADTAGYVIVNGVTYYSKGMLNSNAAMDGYIIIPKTSTSSSSPSRPEYAYYSSSGWYKIANDLTSGNVTATAITDTDYIALAKIHAYSAEGIVTVTPITPCLLSSITQPIDLYYEGIVATVTQYTNASITPYKITRSGDGYTKAAITARNARRGAVVFDTRAVTPTASTAAPRIMYYNGTYWNEIPSSNALYSKAIAIMAGDLLGIAGYYRTKELPIPSICGTYMETLYCNIALIERFFSQQATIDELQSLSLLFSEYCGSINSKNPSIGDMMIYMGKNPRLTAATREFQFAISQYLGKVGQQEMWSDKLITKFLASGLLALNLIGCVQTTDGVYSRHGELWEEINLDNQDDNSVAGLCSKDNKLYVFRPSGRIDVLTESKEKSSINSLYTLVSSLSNEKVTAASVYGGKFVVALKNSIYTSSDLLSWTRQDITLNTASSTETRFINWRGGNKFICQRRGRLYITEDFSSWLERTSPSYSAGACFYTNNYITFANPGYATPVPTYRLDKNLDLIEEEDIFSNSTYGKNSIFFVSDNSIYAMGKNGITVINEELNERTEIAFSIPQAVLGDPTFYKNKIFFFTKGIGIQCIDLENPTTVKTLKQITTTINYGYAWIFSANGALFCVAVETNSSGSTDTDIDIEYCSFDEGKSWIHVPAPAPNYFGNGFSFIPALNSYFIIWRNDAGSSIKYKFSISSRGREAGSGIISESKDSLLSSENGNVVFSDGVAFKWGDSTPQGADTIVNLSTIIAQSFTETGGYIVYSNGLKIQWLKYQDGFAVNTVKDNLYLPLPFTSPSTCEIIGYYDNSSGTMALSAVGARLYGNNTNRFKAITNGGQYSFFAIGY